ncbi:MAG TPA: HAMP domain-containing sensor histidine kinase [Candidatus Acidoferrum sp.]|nr:HAMP domain-containing sensor histidine kinase [Candidatus Acidoferrum sp.]
MSFKRAHIFALAIVTLAGVCGVLAFLQYRWIGEVAAAEQQRLQQELQRNLNFVRRDFNVQIAAACAALLPSEKEVEQLGAEKAYAQRYQGTEPATRKVFGRVALAVPENEDLAFLLLDSSAGEFRESEWPASWANLRAGLKARLAGEPTDPRKYRPQGVIEYPRFAAAKPASEKPLRREAEQEWLLLDLDRKYLSSVLLPSLLQRYLSQDGQPQYSVLITESADPREVVSRWGPQNPEPGNRADASITLFELNSDFTQGLPRGLEGGLPEEPFRRPLPEHRPSSRRNPDSRLTPGSRPEMLPPNGPPGAGLWTLRANHAAGSLEAIVARARRRNLFLAAGLLSLLLATMVALIRFTRGAEKLAEMQMNFVSGVSHELRTPLTVLRAAGYSLHSKFPHQPEQVQRYGKLIEDESKKLTALVEQILRYGSAESGRVLGTREPVSIPQLLNDSLPADREVLADAGVMVEEKIADGLPTVRADRESLQHALRNLIENAIKHGGKDGDKVRVSAACATLGGVPAVCISIQDRGPGIPREERELIFQPFFRGKRATEDQVRGTGLGLHLARRIIEAHGGTLELLSIPGQGTEFLATIPATSDAPHDSPNISADSPG